MLNKDLTDIRKQKVIDSSIQREDEQKGDINDVSLGYHKLYYTAYTSERIERDKKEGSSQMCQTLSLLSLEG